MASRPAKIRRLAAIGIPHARLVEIISRIKADPIDDDDHVDRWTIKRSLDDLWNRAGCTISVPTTSGEFEWQCLSFPKVLQLAVSESDHMKGNLRDLFLRDPCT